MQGTETSLIVPSTNARELLTHTNRMLSLLARRSVPAAGGVRCFAKAASIPTKYNVLTIPALRDNFSCH